jgi:DNA-binding MltR family transcriptional regulator
MSNTLITPTQVLREALRVLHNNLVFVKNVNKQYSKEFAISPLQAASGPTR